MGFSHGLVVKNPPAKQETRVQNLGQEDPLQKEMATDSNLLAWKSHGQRSLAGYSPRGHKESDQLNNWVCTHLLSYGCVIFHCACKLHLFKLLTTSMLLNPTNMSLCSSNLAINSIWPNWLKPLPWKALYFFMAVLSLPCYVWVFSVCSDKGLLSSCGAWASYWDGFTCCGAQALWCTGFSSAAHGFSSFNFWDLEHRSIVVVHGLNCFTACGIFPDHGWNSCLLHWQVYSLPLSHQGSPYPRFLYPFFCWWAFRLFPHSYF